MKTIEEQPEPIQGESAEEILLKNAGRLWFNEEDDLDDNTTGYVKWPDALKAMKEYAQSSPDKVIIAKQEELIELKNNLLNCLDSLRIIQSALVTYDGSDEYSPEHRKLSNKEDKEYFKSEKLRKSIVKLEQELKELKGIDHK